MAEQSFRQRRATFSITVGISAAALLVWMLTAWFAYTLDNGLNPAERLGSGYSGQTAYVLTLILGLLGFAAGLSVLTGVALVRRHTDTYAWVFYLVLGLPLALMLIVPLQRFGVEPWGGLPPFLVSVPAHVVAGVGLGALVFSTTDVRNWVSRGWIGRRRAARADRASSAQVATAAARGLPGQFTPAGWRVLWAMQEEARRFEHNFVGTEHLLLALLRDRESVAARVLVNLGADLDTVQSQVGAILARRGTLLTGTGGLTRRCQRAIETAARLARESGQRQVGTGQLLEGLVSESEDAAVQMLDSMEVTPERVEAEIKRIGLDAEETNQATP